MTRFYNFAQFFVYHPENSSFIKYCSYRLTHQSLHTRMSYKSIVVQTSKIFHSSHQRQFFLSRKFCPPPSDLEFSISIFHSELLLLSGSGNCSMQCRVSYLLDASAFVWPIGFLASTASGMQ